MTDSLTHTAACHPGSHEGGRSSVPQVGSWVFNVALDVFHGSAETCRILGLPAGWPISFDALVRLIHPADRAAQRKSWRAILRGGSFDVVCRLIVGGKTSRVRIQAQADCDAFGVLALCVGTLQDVTALAQGDAYKRIAALAFEAQEGMLVTNADGRILQVNHAFTEITGYSAAEATGMNPRLLHSGRQDAAFYARMWEQILRVGSWQGEVWNRRKTGEVYPEWLTITAVRDGLENTAHTTHYVGTLSDISHRKALEDEVRQLAYEDPLTGLPNRRLLTSRLNQALARAARSVCTGAIFFIDLDGFKSVNDKLGHAQGDCLLQQVAARLSACIRAGDTAARLAGDEFVILLENLDGESAQALSQAQAVGRNLLAALNQPYTLAGHECNTTASIGVALFRSDQETVDALFNHADMAMYHAKAAGRNALRFFDPEMQSRADKRTQFVADFQKGLENNEFILHFQAQVDERGRLTGAEALVRWQHPLMGFLHPAEFIPDAEACCLTAPLGRWVLANACRQLAAWASQADYAHLSLSVNISAAHFGQADFVTQVLSALDLSGARPDRLILEITESRLFDDLADSFAKMTALHEQGVSFSLDNFGTGFSSIPNLRYLPLSHLKIDRSFLVGFSSNSGNAEITRSMIALANSLGFSVIAEGVETCVQHQLLASQGCHAYQGYLFGRPGPVNALR